MRLAVFAGLIGSAAFTRLASATDYSWWYPGPVDQAPSGTAQWVYASADGTVWLPGFPSTASDTAQVVNGFTIDVFDVAQAGTLSIGGSSITIGGVNIVGTEYLQGSTVTQGGGTNNAGTLVLDLNGSYSMGGGTANFGVTYVGGDVNAPNGAGTLSVSGGVATVTGALTIWGGNGSSVNLSGGTLSVGSINLTTNPTTAFNWTGGTLAVTGTGGLAINSSGPLGAFANLDSSRALNVSAAELIGTVGSGTLVQSGGTNSCGSLIIGSEPASSGTYTLTGGVLQVSGGESLAISPHSTGVFYQSGGTNNITANYNLQLSSGNGSSANYTLTGTGILTAPAEDIGVDEGIANFVQSGGTNQIGTYGLYVAIGAGGSPPALGTYTLAGTGSLSAPIEYVGVSGGIGNFQQSGGTNSVTSAESIGLSGSGAYIQTGGSNASASQLGLGVNSGSSGVYSLSGTGLLTVNQAEYVGSSGSGAFNQTGGSNTTAALYLGYSAGSTGQYSLGGTGSLSVSGRETVGYSGAGTFIQTGGSNTMGGALRIAQNAGASGSYILQGGRLTAASTVNNGTLSVTGGTASLGPVTGTGSLVVGSAAAAPVALSIPSFSQSSLVIQAGGTLAVAYNATPAANNVNSLTITTGGQLDISNSKLFVHYPAGDDPIATIAGYVDGGYNAGKWDGSGIISTAAGAAHVIGYTDSGDTPGPGQTADTIELQLVTPGDTTGKGSVTLSDLLTLVRNFGKPDANWTTGDFNYDGTVDAADFLILARNFGGGVSASLLAGLDPADRVRVEGIEDQVPEPTGFGVIAIGAMGLRCRRSKS